MKLDIHDQIIFRTPRFPLNASLENSWEELKQAISESSEDFYAVIKDLRAEDIASLPASIRHTIWKYFNRAKHRSTPFGSFAAVGICKGGFPREKKPVTVQPDLVCHRFADWSLKNELEYTFGELLQKNGSLFTNSTYYRIGDSLRYITFLEGKFEIAEMEADDFLLRVLEWCRKPTPIRTVVSKLKPMFPEAETIEEHLEALISLQLLFTSLDANITGMDYFTRIGRPMVTTVKKQYIISERKIVNGEFDLRLLNPLDKLVGILRQCVPIAENPMLDDFIRRFGRRFEGREVPLMVALDPEIGVGYGNMESSLGIDDTIALLAANKTDNTEKSNPIKDTLSAQLFGDMRNATHCIQLEEFVTKADHRPVPLPNTFNCLFTAVDGTVWLEHCGGATATSLAGRFTLGVDEIHAFTTELAALESTANPDVIFFDMAYTAETHVDNVNRRRHIYDYQLSLLSYDTSPKPLTADDILISLQGSQPMLRSRKLGKRLVPRLASAYNHTRSDLPVFRLLCDLQQHGLQGNLLFRPEQLFPELSHYPRIQYRHIVLSPEKWRISHREVKAGNLDTCLSRLGAIRYFRCGVADQTLYFDRQNPTDMAAFSHYLSRMKSLLVEESPIPKNSTVVDKSGNPYAVQYMATFSHRERIYQPVENTMPIAPVNRQAIRSFLPGSEWLYIEVHCHPQRTDNLLCKVVNHLNKLYGSLIRQWFFIHYDEGESPHIRLRFLLYRLSDNQTLTAVLSSFLEKDVMAGIVSDIRVRTYHRELERYGSDLIDSVENHFCRDSVCVIPFLENGIPDHQRYRFSMEIIKLVMDEALPGMENMEEWTDRVLHSLQGEHRLAAKDFALLNKKYREFTDTQATIRYGIPGELASSFLYVLEQCPVERRNRLFSDLFHMHVNRMFPSHQRTHEMTLYYFLQKDLKSANYRSKQNS